MTDKRTAEILRDAAQVMCERGMTKARFCGDDGRVCARGAIIAALDAELISLDGNRIWARLWSGDTVSKEFWKADEALAGHLHSKLKVQHHGAKHMVAGWNNEPVRNQCDVINAMIGCADALDPEGADAAEVKKELALV